MMVLPVAKEKLLSAIHAATLATSSGLPHLFIGDSSAAICLSSGVIDSYVAKVAMLPRAKLYALILLLPYSLAIDFVKAMFAAFAMAYGEPAV